MSGRGDRAPNPARAFAREDRALGPARTIGRGPSKRVRRSSRSLLFSLGLTLLLFTLPEAAGAGTYDLRACAYEFPLNFDAKYEQYGAGRVDVVHNCNTRARGWFGIYQTRKGTPFADGEGAGFRWYAPPGAEFISSRVYGELRNANGIAAQVYATNPDGGYYPLDANTPHDGTGRQMFVDFSGAPRSQVAMRLACLTKPPCSNRATDVKAFFELSQITLTLRDSLPPTVAAGGDLFQRPAGQDIYRGRVDFTYTAADAGGGIHQPYAEINSTVLELGDYHCEGARAGFTDRTKPCPAQESRQASLDTTRPPFGEGVNSIRICVRDYATSGYPNVACTPVRGFTVDNLPPGAPVGLTVAGGEEWRAANGFDVEWSNPPGQTTPVIAAHYRLEDAVTGAIVQGERQVGAAWISALRNIQVPRAGHFRIRVWLRDAAGNLGPAATASLRLDDQPPGDAALREPPPWLSARDFPYRHEFVRAVPAGPSGVLGFAATINPDQPSPPCPSGRCRPEDLASAPSTNADADNGTGLGAIEIDHLEQGTHWLSIASVSGALLRSEHVHSVPLRVDREDPVTELAGAPEGWGREPVTIHVRASDRLSGMQPDPDQPGGPPLTAIAIEGEPIRQEVGAHASLRVAREGRHRVKYWARDLAGNANDGSRRPNGHLHDPPGEAVVAIDWSAPTVAFLGQDPRRPELIRAQVKDGLSGVAGGEIAFRPAGTDQSFTPLATELVAGRLEAWFPSDELDEGSYEFQALTWDRAGNVGAGDRWENGAAMVLRVPLKAPVAIVAGFSKSAGARQLLQHGGTAVVEGRLTDSEGTPLAAAPIEILERFDPGARTDLRVTRIATDAEGRYRLRLRPGPSRRISARFPGDRLLARTESAPLRLVVRSRVRFKIVPQVVRNRDAVRMRGRVRGRGAGPPAGGKLVAIQYLDPGRRRWRPAELVRTDRRGRFRYRYRFRTVGSPQRFVFRAVAPAEAGWPYRPAHSAGEAVVVYPR